MMRALEGQSASLEPTSLLAGTPYRALQVLGKGSMGSVYQCEHKALGSKVVVKVLHAELAQQPEVVERVRIEAQAQAKLKSPHLLSCTDFGLNSAGAPYLVTEYLAGRTLSDELEARGALPVAEAVQLTIQLLRGLAVAHAAGIVHRDVKPSNIFLAQTESGRLLKLLDFGIAKVLAERTDDAPAPSQFPTAEGMMVGTPRFCSPEQALARPLDHRSDLYSAGLVLYQMLAGRGPFEGKRSMADMLLAQAVEKPVPVSTFAAGVPLAIDQVIAKAIEKAPDDRHASAAEMIRALEHALASTTTLSAAVTAPHDTTGCADDTERDVPALSPANAAPAVVPQARSNADDDTVVPTFEPPPPAAPMMRPRQGTIPMQAPINIVLPVVARQARLAAPATRSWLPWVLASSVLLVLGVALFLLFK